MATLSHIPIGIDKICHHHILILFNIFVLIQKQNNYYFFNLKNLYLDNFVILDIIVNIKPLKKQIISANIKIAESVYVLSFKRDFEFIPGQVIGISNHPTEIPRLYSIASGNQENEIRILYDIKEEGKLTPWLAERNTGEFIYYTKVSGNFISKMNENAYWIASGTGIAPFASMFFSGNFMNKHLIHGGKYLESFYFGNEFEEKLGEHYIRCCTREQGEGVYKGRLTQYLRDNENLNPTHKYYLCGSTEMVVETRDILLAKKIPFENVIGEIYF